MGWAALGGAARPLTQDRGRGIRSYLWAEDQSSILYIQDKDGDENFNLWCVGLDGKDDGGKRVLSEKHPENTKFADAKYIGDWVWDFPAN